MATNDDKELLISLDKYDVNWHERMVDQFVATLGKPIDFRFMYAPQVGWSNCNALITLPRKGGELMADTKDNQDTEPMLFDEVTPLAVTLAMDTVDDELPAWATNVPTEPDISQDTEHWTVGKWGAYDNYMCAHCMYATVDGIDAIRAHVESRHVDQVPTLIDTGLIDGNGKPIMSSGGFR